MAWVEFAENIELATGKFFRRRIIDESEYNLILAEHIRRGQISDIYHSIFQYDRSDPNDLELKIRGPLYFDFDVSEMNEDNYKELTKQVRKAISYLQTEFKIPFDSGLYQIFFSGHKGFHILLDPEIFNLPYTDPYILVNAYKRIAQNMHCPYLDTQIYDKRRVFRIENSLNSKSGLYKVPLKYDQIPSTWEEMRQIALEPRTSNRLNPYIISEAVLKLNSYLEGKQQVQSHYRNIRYSSFEPIMFPCTEYLLNKVQVHKGNRNNVTVALANGLFRAGYNSDQVKEMIQIWNAKNEPPLSDCEILSTVLSAQHMSARNQYYGCATMKELGLCLPYCKIYDREVKRL